MEDIKVYVPIDTLTKSKEDSGVLGRIRGVASTPDLDRDGEKVMQEGLDISYFLDRGFFNWDHDNSKIVGYPDKDKTQITKDGLYVEGYILNTSDGKRVWDTAIALQKSKTPRRLGFSIEGQVLKRGLNGRIEKARVNNIALTSTPVNTKTSWNALVKSMTGERPYEVSPLVKQSLENAKIACQAGLDGDEEVIKCMDYLITRSNEDTSENGVRTFLRLFKGVEGEELDTYTDEVLKALPERKGQ